MKSSVGCGYGEFAGIPRISRLTAISFSLAMLGTSAHAGSMELGDETKMDYLVTLGYGVNVRTEKQSDKLTGNINGDDGDRNFDRGSLVNNRVSVLAEANVYRRNLGFLIRGSSFYDFAYYGDNDNDSPGTVNKFGPHDEFSSAARRYSGSRSRLLDAYVYGNFDLGGDRTLDLRLGNQVVAWGESLFISGISGVQGPVDATKANVPGTEIKDILLPEWQASANLAINREWSLLGYYQFRWHPYELSPVGGYFSTTDVVGPGARFIRLPFAPPFDRISRAKDDEARDSGQWGIGTRYLVTANTQVGLYHLRYHDKLPNVVFNPDGTYRVKYFEDIKLTGASISTRLGDWQVSGEASYKSDVPLLVDLGGGAVQPSRGEAAQLQVSWIKTWGKTFLADQSSFAGEVGALRALSVEPVNGVTKLVNDRDAMFYQFNVTLTYPNALPGWDVSIPFTFGQQFKNSAIGSFGFGGDGDRRASIGATFKHLDNLEIGITYNAFLGSPDPVTRPLADRDFVALSAKYSF